MAQVTYRGNLSAKVFPFVAEYFGPSIIIPGPDQNFQRQLTSSEDLDKDRGIPQVYYCHNVMPMAEGFQSIGYNNVITDIKSGFTNIFILRDATGNEVFFSYASDGKTYVLPSGATSWTQIGTIATGASVSVAAINGQSYIYFSQIGCYMYDSGTNSLVAITLTGLDPTKVLGITSSAGYMIAWTATTIAWSSTVAHTVPTDPIDFVPSLVTGAGGGNVEEAEGKITICVKHYLGFIIYTTDNAVASVYSGNARFPFNLRKIVNAGGLSDSSLISFDSSSGNHYAYTTSGLQLVSMSQTQTVFPEITDFISGSYFEDFDETALKLIHQVLAFPMQKAINAIADRYLVVSYGINSLTHALVYDIVQKRFGKLRVDHVASFEWKILGTTTQTPKQSLGFLQANGSIKTVDFSYTSAITHGVVLLGKYQLSRARLFTLDEVTLENVRISGNFNLYNCVSYEGKHLEHAVAGYLTNANDTGNRYTFRQTGTNHTLIAIGGFYFSAIVLKGHINGSR